MPIDPAVRRGRLAVVLAGTPLLREELAAVYPNARFNATRRAVLSGDRARASSCAAHEWRSPASTCSTRRSSPRCRNCGRQQIRRRPRHDRSRRGAAHGVSVRWTPGVNRQAVAELTICFHDRALPTRRAAGAQDLPPAEWRHPGGRQLSSATIGIVGCGHVGQQVARICRAFGAPRRRARHPRSTTTSIASTGVTPLALDALLDAGGHRHDPCAARRVDARD